METAATATEATAAPTPGEDDGWEWAIVEIMGFRKHAGRCREEERFGAKMLRIDIPTFTPEPTLFDKADGKQSQPTIAWTTHYYGGSSIFSFTLTDQDSVMRANKPYEPPSRVRLSAPSPADDLGDDPFGNEAGED